MRGEVVSRHDARAWCLRGIWFLVFVAIYATTRWTLDRVILPPLMQLVLGAVFGVVGFAGLAWVFLRGRP